MMGCDVEDLIVGLFYVIGPSGLSELDRRIKKIMSEVNRADRIGCENMFWIFACFLRVRS